MAVAQNSATVFWTRMIYFDFSAVVRPICRRTSAEVESYTQHCCRATEKEEAVLLFQTSCFTPTLSQFPMTFEIKNAREHTLFDPTCSSRDLDDTTL